jgi:hypothetical protein
MPAVLFNMGMVLEKSNRTAEARAIYLRIVVDPGAPSNLKQNATTRMNALP